MRVIQLFVIILFLSADSLKINRIIGGTLAYAGQFSFSAAIYKTTSDGTFFCGGTLFSQEWILTAGQCVDGATLFSITLGTTNIKIHEENGLRVATDSYVLHPDYNPETLENDIGLIKLRLPLELNPYVAPIRFLPENSLQASTATIGIGWGQIDDATPGIVDQLRWTRLIVMSDEECKMVYGGQIKEGMICAGGNYNEGACHGDTGSPLLQDLGRGYMRQVGISSFISGNGCESTDPSGYTDIFPYLDWLNNVTGTQYS